MEEAALTNGDFWTAREPAVFVDPRRLAPSVGELLRGVPAQSPLRSCLLFATSGTTGSLRFACLTREALLASANAVNAALGITAADRWLAAIPAWHVGGCSIFARAWLSGSPMFHFPRGWDSRRFCAALTETRATLSSLVPTQVYDLVESCCSCPADLRILLVGGAALDTRLHQRALDLGWPVRTTYGMTETASQVATQLDTRFDAPLVVLDSWETRVNSAGLLELRGPALFSGYINPGPADAWTFEAGPPPGGWFTSADYASLESAGLTTTLRFLGRSSDSVKIKGDLVHIDGLRRRWSNVAPQAQQLSALAARTHPRDGWEIVVAAAPACPPLSGAVERFNAEVSGCERIGAVCNVPALPRTALGKLDEPALRKLLDSRP